MSKLTNLFPKVSTPLAVAMETPSSDTVSLIAKQDIRNMASVGIVAANEPTAPRQAQTFTAA